MIASPQSRHDRVIKMKFAFILARETARYAARSIKYTSNCEILEMLAIIYCALYSIPRFIWTLWLQVNIAENPIFLYTMWVSTNQISVYFDLFSLIYVWLPGNSINRTILSKEQGQFNCECLVCFSVLGTRIWQWLCLKYVGIVN